MKIFVKKLLVSNKDQFEHLANIYLHRVLQVCNSFSTWMLNQGSLAKMEDSGQLKLSLAYFTIIMIGIDKILAVLGV